MQKAKHKIATEEEANEGVGRNDVDDILPKKKKRKEHLNSTSRSDDLVMNDEGKDSTMKHVTSTENTPSVSANVFSEEDGSKKKKKKKRNKISTETGTEDADETGKSIQSMEDMNTSVQNESVSVDGTENKRKKKKKKHLLS